MDKNQRDCGLAVKTSIRAGGLNFNHNAIAVKTGVKAGVLTSNHNGTQLKSQPNL